MIEIECWVLNKTIMEQKIKEYGINHVTGKQLMKLYKNNNKYFVELVSRYQSVIVDKIKYISFYTEEEQCYECGNCIDRNDCWYSETINSCILNNIDFIYEFKRLFIHNTWRVISLNISIQHTKFIEKFADHIHWGIINYDKYADVDFINKYHKKILINRVRFENLDDYDVKHIGLINWHSVSYRQKLPKWFLIKHKNNLIWSTVSCYIDIEFIQYFKDVIKWEVISRRNHLGEKFIVKYIDRLNLKLVCVDGLSEKFIGQYIEQFSKTKLSNVDRKYSKQFLNKYKNKFDWNMLSIHQNFSEAELIEIKDICWYVVCIKRKLSEEFIIANIDKIQWKNIARHQNLSEKFILKHCEHFGFASLGVDNAIKLDLNSNELLKYKCFDLHRLEYFIKDIWYIVLRYTE